MTAPSLPAGVDAFDVNEVPPLNITARVMVCAPPDCTSGDTCLGYRLGPVRNISAACGIVSWPGDTDVMFGTSLGELSGARSPNTTYSVTFTVVDGKGFVSQVRGRLCC